MYNYRIQVPDTADVDKLPPKQQDKWVSDIFLLLFFNVHISRANERVPHCDNGRVPPTYKEILRKLATISQLLQFLNKSCLISN